MSARNQRGMWLSSGQRDFVLNDHLHGQPINGERGPRLQRLGPSELPAADAIVHCLLHLALRRDAELLQELAHAKVEHFLVHTATLPTPPLRERALATFLLRLRLAVPRGAASRYRGALAVTSPRRDSLPPACCTTSCTARRTPHRTPRRPPKRTRRPRSPSRTPPARDSPGTPRPS